MDPEFWLNCWQKDHIGFHQLQTDVLLAQHFSHLVKEDDKHVLVPLCGKSQDMFFLARQMRVTGAELSEIACADFFNDSGLSYTRSPQGDFQQFSFANINLWQGDFFKLQPTMLSPIDWIYDRAALFALPKTMQIRYVRHLLSFMRPNTRLLLIALEFAEHELTGPPFPLCEPDIKALFSAENSPDASDYNIQCLASRVLSDKQFGQRIFNVSQLVERLYLITST